MWFNQHQHQHQFSFCHWRERLCSQSSWCSQPGPSPTGVISTSLQCHPCASSHCEGSWGIFYRKKHILNRANRPLPIWSLRKLLMRRGWPPWSLLLRLQWLMMKPRGQPWSRGGVSSWWLWWTSHWQRRHLPLPEPPTFSWAESLFLLTKCKYVKCEQSFVMSCPLLIAE